jgi:hypothetical protein
MLVCSLMEEDSPALEEVQTWLAGSKDGQQLRDVSDYAGGGKHPQFLAMSAGINGFWDDEEFIAYVLARNWSDPENLVLVIQPEDGATRVFRPGNYQIDRLEAPQEGGLSTLAQQD